MANVIVLVLIVAVIAAISIQNATPVVLAFLFWKIDTSLSVVIFVSMLAGVLLAAVAALSGNLKKFLNRKQAKP